MALCCPLAVTCSVLDRQAAKERRIEALFDMELGWPAAGGRSSLTPVLTREDGRPRSWTRGQHGPLLA